VVSDSGVIIIIIDTVNSYITNLVIDVWSYHFSARKQHQDR